MSGYVTTGSAIERAMHCISSLALPHARFDTPASSRGTAIHKFLEKLAERDENGDAISVEAALDQVDDEWRDACAALDLTGLDDHLSLTAEVAIAYNVVDDTARVLGYGDGASYSDVGEDEIPCRLDVVGMRTLDTGIRRGLVIDWKSGWYTRRKRVRSDWQLKFGALAASRAFSLDACEVQLINVGDSLPYARRCDYGPMDLDRIAMQVAELHERALEVRAEFAAGKWPATFNMGDWCTFCPGKLFCPAHTRLIRSVMSMDEIDDVLRVSPMPPEVAADAYLRVRAARRALNVIESQVKAIAAAQPLFLGLDEFGIEHWLGRVVKAGNEKLDGAAVYAAVEHVLGEDAADDATTLTSTKKQIESAIKAHVKRGEGARTMRAVLEHVRASGGASRTPRENIEEYAVKPAPAVPALPEGATTDDDHDPAERPALDAPPAEPEAS